MCGYRVLSGIPGFIEVIPDPLILILLSGFSPYYIDNGQVVVHYVNSMA